MAIITLLSDWNQDNLYGGLLKSKIYEVYPNARIVDFSHQIIPFHSGMAATTLRFALRHSPPGTVHLLLTNTMLNGKYPLLAIKHQNQYVIGVDKEVFTLVFDHFPELVIHVDTSEFTYVPSFPELDVFPVLAAYIAKGGDMLQLGNPVSEFIHASPYQPVETENGLIGHVIFIDTYSNAITNISENRFRTLQQSRDFEITFRSMLNKINRISPYYEPARTTTLQAVFNAAGLLELASYQARLCELHDIALNTEINIRFYDNTNH